MNQDIHIDIDSLIEPVSGYDRPENEPILEPFRYLEAIPGNNQGVRTRFLIAFNTLYFHIGHKELLDSIGEIISIFHNSSLLIDDIEDSSEYRRGVPAAHTKYGVPLTINCGNLMYFIALQKAQITLPDLYKRLNPSLEIDMDKHKFETSQILIDEMLNLHHGQGLDIYWRDYLPKDQKDLPLIEDYLSMVKDKTGGLFRLSIKLLGLFSSRETRDLIPIANLLGIIYQVRDDYMNLTSTKYSHMKGIKGEDLVEGKLSLPILHCLRHSKESPVHELLYTTKSSDERKAKIELIADSIEYMKDVSGSLDFTLNLLHSYHGKVKQMIAATAEENADDSLLLQIVDQLCNL
ncbi:geranylgeranyl diphosphate synthase [Scheffersomyces xylosifermentans]|uniref:geranylgeranyl diphosphate synthase n=1 Tax=Scheffersomyces xylosifermentans TaxID=1304137 RepID=UPI00315DCA4A